MIGHTAISLAQLGGNPLMRQQKITRGALVQRRRITGNGAGAAVKTILASAFKTEGRRRTDRRGQTACTVGDTHASADRTVFGP